MPEEADPNGVDRRGSLQGGTIVSIVPRKKRLEDLFVETVTNRPIPAGAGVK